MVSVIRTFLQPRILDGGQELDSFDALYAKLKASRSTNEDTRKWRIESISYAQEHALFAVCVANAFCGLVFAFHPDRASQTRIALRRITYHLMCIVDASKEASPSPTRSAREG